MNQFLQLKDSERREAFLAAEENYDQKSQAYIIEKDFWVTAVLEILYTKVAPKLSGICEQPFIFKGGTSLSKCFNLIDRMSEDIDLSLSLKLLNKNEVTRHVTAGRNYHHRIAKEIDAAAEIFVEKTLLQPLKKHLEELDERIEVYIEDCEPLNISIQYPSLFDDSEIKSVQPRVLIETGGRSQNVPVVNVSITHILGSVIPQLADQDFEVIALAPERTILEKMFGVHTNLTQEKLLPKYARHLYDIVKLNEENRSWCTNKELFLSHVEFSDLNYKTHQDSCDTARTGPIKLSPNSEKMVKHYSTDWESMADMFPYSVLPYTFDELIARIKVIEESVNDAFYS
ncbi:Nucleotidyl transferase AbiEii toxin, Type IV TA system [Pseudidiomarina planktonica]|uniref:Nucleotidyl transferase AbiEii toxin, Type IV TA system n=1 Tax=Pseudidiomarina planktonica TaxID=1323738 RepID=A0A1Y6EUF4_9GAMM|nr:nucleotidyl transferase AbiEii/AbiGii toxin family protein [Pseudidiomarina planktonica]RUO65606.1 nucleotidyl transferase AbiEii/AbiGii toxin family protein [Pseudidiomarina planktonica]SMQ64142.1 Nucleotidyl transferase AbiEii toxin, Type IV TA system [Pseudidiomarina planktonica]